MALGIIVAAVLVLVLAIGIALTFSLIGLAVTLVVAAVIGWVADRIVPGELPYGWLGATVAGLLGSWLGSLLIGRMGPVIGGIPLVSALIGALIVAFLVEIAGKRWSRRQT